MKSFSAHFHKEDQVNAMEVKKLNEQDFEKVTEGGTRHLFELDTNIGFFVFFDAEDADGRESYLVLQYEDDNEDPSACYGFKLKDFYQFTALFLNDMEFSDETDDEEEEEYGPIHHLAHLLFHIVEQGNSVEV